MSFWARRSQSPDRSGATTDKVQKRIVGRGSIRVQARSDGAPSAVTATEQSDTAIARGATFGIASIPTPVLIGVLGFVLVLLLRLAGVIVGPIAVVLAAISLVLAPGPRRLSDRFILFFAIGFGWLTLLGWIPRLETTIDVPGILLAIGFGVAAANQFHNRRIRLSLPQWPLATEAAAITIGTAATLWWALPFLRLNLSRTARSALSRVGQCRILRHVQADPVTRKLQLNSQPWTW